ncbi:Leukocyte elastase inhibitor [Halotydeus destructor]|nr:Leukocyte elastase inhibitor [Halotydeus destructor]
MATNELGQSINQFGVDFLKQVSSRDNAFFSSASISTAFAMLLAGSAGDSSNQLKAMLKLEKIGDVNEQFGKLMNILKPRTQTNETYQLNTANKLVVNNDITVAEQFRKVIENQFKATIDAVNIAKEGPKVTADINNWVKEQTKGMIKQILNEPLDANTKLVILNAIYFKGTWVNKFHSGSTHKAKFHGSKENEIDFMHKLGEVRVHEEKDKALVVIELPYVGSASMVIILPDSKDGLKSLIEKLSNQDIEDLIKKVTDTYDREAHIYLPKFKLETEFDLVPILSKLGAKDIFDPSKADLGGVSNSRLFVTAALHKAVVDVNEEGTEAAAVTAIMARCYMSTPIQPPTYRVDRPFLFFIRDNVSGINLFAGKIGSL